MWYKILGVNKKASQDEIYTAYQRILKNEKIAFNPNELVKVHEAYKVGMKFSTVTKVQKIKSRVALASVLVLILLISLSFSTYVFADKIFIKEKEANLALECLEYNFSYRKISYIDVEKKVKELGYTINEIESETFTAYKEFKDVKVIFEFSEKDAFSKCKLSIKEQIEGTYFETYRFINSTGYGLSILDFGYYLEGIGYYMPPARDDKFVYIGIYGQLTPSTTVDNYELIHGSNRDGYDYSNVLEEETELTYSIDKERDLYLRDVIYNAANEFR